MERIFIKKLKKVVNVFLNDSVNFPLTKFKIKIKDIDYLKVNLNEPLIIISPIEKNSKVFCGLIAEIQSFDKAVDTEIYLQLYGRERIRVLRYLENELIYASIPDNLISAFLDEKIKMLIDYLNTLLVRLSSKKGVTIYALKEKIQGYLSILKEAFSNDLHSRYLSIVMNLAKEIITRRFYRVKFTSLNFDEKISLLIVLIERYVQSIFLEYFLQEKVQEKLAIHQRQFVINERIKLLQQQLDVDELNNFSSNWNKAPKYFQETVRKEMKRLEGINRLSPEYPQQKKVVEVLTQLPWDKRKVKYDEEEAKIILNRSHYGLEKIKEEIFDFMNAYVHSKGKFNRVLCFVGGAGIGKTTISRSIAKTMKRDFCKINLAGCSEGSFILGTSRTYLYSQPGSIINNLIKLKYNNPVILLDEIDKTIQRFSSGGSAIEYALLYILDPENNPTFKDHFIDEMYPLKDIFFIATANDVSSIPIPLKNRMSIIYLDAYSIEEKIIIAQKWLLPNIQKELNSSREFKLSNETLKELIEKFTMESGVRHLKRIIEKLFISFLRGKLSLTPELSEVTQLLSFARYRFLPNDNGLAQVNVPIALGRSIGLWASDYSSVGGIMVIDTYHVPKKSESLEQPIVTGSVSDVIKEVALQAMIAVYNLLISLDMDNKAKRIISDTWLIHYSSAAQPKDGPSAGIATAMALLSLLLEKSIDGWAFTGEINGQGEAMVVGGIDIKVAGMIKNGYTKMILPKANLIDVEMLDKTLKDKVEIHLIENLEETVRIVWGIVPQKEKSLPKFSKTERPKGKVIIN